MYVRVVCVCACGLCVYIMTVDMVTYINVGGTIGHWTVQKGYAEFLVNIFFHSRCMGRDF